MVIKSSVKQQLVLYFLVFFFLSVFFCFKMTLTSILNDRGESIIGILNKKTADKIVLIVHGEQGIS